MKEKMNQNFLKFWQPKCHSCKGLFYKRKTKMFSIYYIKKRLVNHSNVLKKGGYLCLRRLD